MNTTHKKHRVENGSISKEETTVVVEYGAAQESIELPDGLVAPVTWPCDELFAVPHWGGALMLWCASGRVQVDVQCGCASAPVSLQCPGGWPHSPVPEFHLESGALAEVHPCLWTHSGASNAVVSELLRGVCGGRVLWRRDVSRTRIPWCWSAKILQSPASGGLTSALSSQT